MFDRRETIAAIATAPGKAGVAIVRLSGGEAYEIAARVAGRPIRTGLQFVRLSIDDCVVLGFRSPHSYTGEDVVEFQCHGGTVSSRRILDALFAAGARLARRGEFTERAFLNGKIDYDQAESVLDLINAKTVRAAEAARAGLAGGKAREMRALYEQALDLSTRLEHTLDVDEEDLPVDFADRLRGDFAALSESASKQLRRLQEGQLLRDGALVVLAGPPNAGKSSLLNALLEENRAIVSDIPGTTRDAIEAWLDLGGYPIRLVDTAGLRTTGDVIEAEGVRRSEKLVAEAEIVLALTPSDAPEATDLPQTAGEVIRVRTKCDLKGGSDCREGLAVSVVSGEGLEELRQTVVAALERRLAATDGAVFADEPDGDARAVLLAVGRLLAPFLTDDAAARDPVLAANAARQAAEQLGTLVGATYSQDLLDRLFSRFCVGK